MPNVQTLKGFRDITPELAFKRGRAITLLKSVFKSFGFEPLETPTLEYTSVLEGKYGSEADKLIYKFKDRGGREVGLRYDLTVPLARFIAQNKGTLTFPFKRYQIGNSFRAENPQAGRYREFTQIDYDTVGADTATSDAEIVAVTASALEILNVKDFTILINDRALFADLPKEAVIILDKWEKIGVEGVKRELTAAGFDAKEILRQAQDQKPTDRLLEIFKLLKAYGIKEKSWKFDPLLARGLDYYTGVIFEVKVPNYASSIGGGGRYNNLIGGVARSAKGGPSNNLIPAVGGSFGLDRLMEVVPEATFADIPFRPKVLVTVFSPKLLEETIALFDRIQSLGIDAEIYLDPQARLDKQLKYADRKGIPFAVIFGPEEKSKGFVTLKNLAKQSQQTVGLTDLPQLLN